MRFPTRLSTLSLVLSALGLAPLAYASHFWAATGGVCLPDESDVYAKEWMIGGGANDGKVFIKSGTTAAAIDLRCHLTNPMDGGADPTWDNLEVSYQDPDGAGLGATVIVSRVAAGLDRQTRCGAIVDTLFNSNRDGQDTTACQTAVVFRPVPWDFITYAYHMKVTVRADNPAFRGPAGIGVWGVGWFE